MASTRNDEGPELARFFPEPRRAKIPLIGAEFTEFGAMDRMFQAHGRELLYAKELECFYRFEGNSWRLEKSPVELDELAKSVVTSMKEEALRIEDAQLQEDTVQRMLNLQRQSVSESVVKGLRGRTGIACSIDDLNNDLNLLSVANGTVNLTTGVLTESRPEDRITMTTHARYDPSARAPWFEQTLNDTFQGDASRVAFFQRLVGYSLLGKPVERIMVIATGLGKNGKSTIFNALQEAFGQHAAKMGCETIAIPMAAKENQNTGGPREDLLRLRGKRAVFTSEIKKSSTFVDNTVKDIASGGDMMVARGVHGRDSYEFRPTCVVFCPTNTLPAVRDNDQAMWDRLLVLPFLARFNTPDKRRTQKLQAEIDGILTWAIKGALDYQRVGLCVPQEPEDLKRCVRSDSDVSGWFVEDNCVLNPKARASTEELMTEYNQFMLGKGAGYTSIVGFGKMLQNQGYRSVKFRMPLQVNQVRGFEGIGLKSNALSQLAEVAVVRTEHEQTSFCLSD